MKFIRQLLTFFLFTFVLQLPAQEQLSHSVLVSVAPYKFFVERIVGDTIKVNLVVPTGVSSHSYEPSPRQMDEIVKADLWFCIGEIFESRVLPVLQARNKLLKAIDLRQGLSLIYASNENGCPHGCCHGINGADVHIWLSARLAMQQVKTILHALSSTYPEHTTLFEKNADRFIQELQDLDHQIVSILQPLKQRIVLVSHPAYAYFCRDYQLEQLSIEFEGKDPTPQQLTKLLNVIREKQLKKIFIQPQYSNKGAKTIASQIGATLITLDPYSEQYISAMLAIARGFADQ